MHLTKMSGSGNDFIIIDNREDIVSGLELPDFIRKVCRRGLSVGADGLILIENSEKADFAWRFFNNDGGEVEMCGNGSRCAARFAYSKNIAGPRLKFETLAGIVHLVDGLDQAAAKIVSILEEKKAEKVAMTELPEEIKHALEERCESNGMNLMQPPFDNAGLPSAI